MSCGEPGFWLNWAMQVGLVIASCLDKTLSIWHAYISLMQTALQLLVSQMHFRPDAARHTSCLLALVCVTEAVILPEVIASKLSTDLNVGLGVVPDASIHFCSLKVDTHLRGLPA